MQYSVISSCTYSKVSIKCAIHLLLFSILSRLHGLVRNCTFIQFYLHIYWVCFSIFKTNLAIFIHKYWLMTDFLSHWPLHYQFLILMSRKLLENTPYRTLKDLHFYLILRFLLSGKYQDLYIYQFWSDDPTYTHFYLDSSVIRQLRV